MLVVVTSNSIRNQIESDSKWEDIVAISVGENYIIGLRSDGKLAHAGHDLGDGQCDVDDWENIVSIATGWRHTVALDSKGNVFITGYPVFPKNIALIIRIVTSRNGFPV